ncbi:MAG: response regulator [Spirochaetes bacterium]|nr:response regulator [Spirochaetota bacterium]
MFSKLQAVSIDDEEINLLIIEKLAEKVGLKVISYSDPIAAYEYVKDNEVDLIFVDYMMPKLNGVELIEKIRRHHQNIPIVMITSITGNEKLKIDAIEAGATEFLNKPLKGSEFLARITNLANLRYHQLLLKDKALLLEEEVKKATENLTKREFETLIILGNAAEYKDPETGNHVSRVAHYSRMLAMSLGMSEQDQDNIYYASPLHDVGKIGIPDSILLKPGKLTQEEWETMQTHPTIGYEMLKGSESPFLKTGAIIAKTHHEKYDGSGYPEGLKGEEIHLFGRIVAIADVFDALMTKRPYKEPWEFDKALQYVSDEKGKHFDPEVADHFVRNVAGVQKISNIFKDM